ncbi:unnamed protein product [Linum tenue]|uniref:Homeobox domain-containing protein n=1 Tax=Linum tenue TaxID=586396 RepID=A0AAV0K326_9ROSI|nr:unnamed protein product [Linum tenue]
MASALSAFNTCSSLRSFSSLNNRIFVRGRYMPPPSNLLLPYSALAGSSVAFSRRRNQNSTVSSTPRKKNDDEEEGDDIDEDAFDALFDMLEGDLKNSDSSVGDEDDYDDMSEEDIMKLQYELEEALGADDGEDEAYDMETGTFPREEEEGEKGRPSKLRNWQIRRLASALKKGRRKISIKNLAGDLCLERSVVLDLLRDPPPSLVMLSAALPDEPEPFLPVQETTPVESVTEEMNVEEDGVKDESKVNLPVHVMYHKWNAQKRLKKVHVQTLERVYRRTKRPTNTMVSSIVHVTNLPRKRVVKWFEDKRTEEGVPEQRQPYRRSIHETVSSS